MLAMAGGLIAYREVSQGSSASAATLAPSAEPEELSPRMAPPPPPPPPPEDPSSLPSAEAAATRVIKPGTDPCAARECKGTVTSILQTALSGRAGSGRRCYEKALMQNASLSGRMRLGVRVGPAGQVCSTKVVSDQIGDQGLSTCILGVFRSSTLPAPAGGCVDVEVPLSFVTPK